MAPTAEIKGCKFGVIPGLGSGTVEVSCYFEKESQAADEFALQIIYTIAGERESIVLRVPAEFKSAAQGGFSLKDLKKGQS